MSDGTSSGAANQADGKSESVIASSAGDQSKNGATGKETPTNDGKANAVANGTDGRGAGAEGSGGKPPDAFDFTKWEPKLPEGISLEKGLIDEFRPLAKELGLKGEGAQKLVDLWSKAARTSIEAQLQSKEESRAAGLKTLKADQEFGGTKFAESVKAVGRSLRELGGKELSDRLLELGLDNDPVLMRAFAKHGRSLGEDSVGGTATQAGTEKADTFEARVGRTYTKSQTKES